MQPLISIIVPTFNSAKTLASVLDSVMLQTYIYWECIVIDGASHDNTVDIIKAYHLRDSRFRYVSEVDSGIYDAMNKGWRLSVGEWVLFLGADDTLLPYSLKVFSENIKYADVIYGQCYLVLKNGMTKKRENQRISVIKYRLPCSHQSVMMKKDVITQLDGFNTQYKVLADFDLIQRAYFSGVKFREINEIFSCFYIGGISTNNLSAEKERYLIMKNNKSTSFPLFFVFVILVKKILLKVKHNIIFL